MSQSQQSNILKKIKEALEQPTPLPFPKAEDLDNYFQPLQQDLVVEFAEQFTKLQGKFIFCADKKELTDQFKSLCYQNQWTKIYCVEDEWSTELQLTQSHTDVGTAKQLLPVVNY